MLQLTKPNTFADYAGQPALSTRPVTSGYGLTATPGNNTYGAYAAGGVLAATTGYGLWVHINGVGVSASAKDCLITLGIDVGGTGAAVIDWIADLLGSCSGAPNVGGGQYYYFPILVPAGAYVTAKASVNNATVGVARVQLTTALLPSRSPNAWYGTFVRTFGSTPASSNGTAVTPGTAADGAWTSLGTVAAGDALRYFELGFGINNAAMTTLIYGADVGIGAGGVAKLASSNTMINASASEMVTKQQGVGGWCDAFAGDVVYGRLQCSGTPDAGISMASYGVG